MALVALLFVEGITMYAVTQQEPTGKPQCVLDLEAKILAEESVRTVEDNNARFARLEVKAEKHGVFARIW